MTNNHLFTNITYGWKMVRYQESQNTWDVENESEWVDRWSFVDGWHLWKKDNKLLVIYYQCINNQ